MKFNLYSALCAAGLLAMTACTADDPMLAPAGDGNVAFSISMPGTIGTRAYGDGTQADKLSFRIYDVTDGNETLVYSYDDTPGFSSDGKGNLVTNLRVDLANGRDYQVAWWAQSSKCEAFTFTGKTVSVDYKKVETNSDLADAFYAYTQTFKVQGSAQREVTLRRPFAQINFGTDDMAADNDVLKAAYGENFVNLVSKISVKNVAQTLDLASGNTTDDTEDAIEFAYTKPSLTETFPVAPYKYLAMGYVMAGDTGIADITLTVGNGSHDCTAVSVPGAPIRANYRTNIYGKLLTSPNDFNITLTPGFDGDLEPNKPWDGKTVTYPEINEETKTVEVKAASDLVGLAELVNGTATRAEAMDFDGYTVLLTRDYDLNGEEFPMIGAGVVRKSAEAVGTGFRGIIDGQGHIVKNLSINYTKTDDGSETAAIGFITALKGEGAALKNITFENVNIKGNAAEQTGIVAMCVEGATVSNVKVLSGSISGDQGVGGIVGRMIRVGSITNCENHADISGVKNNIGGIVGAAYYTAAGKVMYVTDCKNYGDIEAGNVCAGGIIGLSAADVTNCYNEGNITAHNNSCGGIMGQQNARGNISKCINKGQINAAESTSLGFGGIMGWLKYDNINSSYFNYSLINIDRCENHGDVIAPKVSHAAGIIGLVYRDAIITNCLNTASKISSADNVAGIANYQNIANSLPNMTNDQHLLTITGCTSTTPLANMTGPHKGEICYDNTTGSNTKFENNTYSPAE